MNQNRISPEQVAQTTQNRSQVQQRSSQQSMSMDELQKTQVLNLQDFKETTRIEKLSSPIHAKILASLGAFLIALGVALPMVQSMSERGKTPAVSSTEFREQSTNVVEKEENNIVQDLTCRLETLNNPNNTDEVINVYYTFNGDKLTNYSKEYILRKSSTATEVPAELASYLSALEPYLAVQIPGYTLNVQQIDNGSITKCIVDYSTLIYSSIPEAFQTNYRFNVPYQASATYSEVKNGLEAQGYMCE